MQGFISSPFWPAMNWNRATARPELSEYRHMQLAEKRFNQFCQTVDSHPRPDYLTVPKNSSIPPLLHFIWLGSALSSNMKKTLDSWKKWHPGWEIMIWNDARVANFPWSSYRMKEGFMHADTWAEKADILRLEILYQYGGIYSDGDVICIKPFHDLITNGISFFAGLEMNEIFKSFGDPLYVGTAVMGAKPKSALIKECLDQYQTKEEAPDLNLIFRAGPALISAVCHEALEKESTLILPCSYFFPIPFKNKHGVQENSSSLSNETMAVHLWEGSWIKVS